MQVNVCGSIEELPADGWNRLAGTDYPFLKYEFVAFGESTGCVAAKQGWQPRHLAIFDGKRLRAAMPLYEKSHSWGEFVFDWAWANAYDQAGLSYYPKLVSATPFTPATSRRLLLADPDDAEAAAGLVEAAIALAAETDCSSLHIQFPAEDEIPWFERAGLLLRKDCQFHWHNRDYRSFEEFLGTFTSVKRKKAKRERRRMQEHGITFRWLSGHDLDDTLWTTVYHLISRTFMMRGSLPYYNREFFTALGATLPDNLLVVLAEQGESAVAAAVFFVGRDRLYGRYWGCEGHFDSLHFETCYYQGIEYCIEHGLQVFEPGTQGEHKISRGFTPATTWSAHWLAHPEFSDAIERFLDAEGRHIEQYMDAVDAHSPYKVVTDDG